MTEKNSLKEKARAEVLKGLKDGTIKIKIIHKCSWCNKSFDSHEAFDSHLIQGKTIDPKTGKKRMICPH